MHALIRPPERALLPLDPGRKTKEKTVAEMAIDRRHRRLSVWPFLVGGLALAIIIGVFLTFREEPRRMLLDKPESADKVTATGVAAPITDLAAIVGPRDRQGLAGREVTFEGVQVLQVLSDRAFLIGPSLSQRALVIYDKTADDPPPKVATGDTVAVHGVMRPIPTDPEVQARLELDELRPSDLADLHVHIDAYTVMPTFKRSAER
jgi:hypothetical protein